MKRGARVIVDRMDVQEIIEQRTIDAMENTINFLIKDKDIILTEETIQMIYHLTSQFTNQITDYVVANNRATSIMGTGTESSTAFHHSTWQL